MESTTNSNKSSSTRDEKGKKRNVNKYIPIKQ